MKNYYEHPAYVLLQKIIEAGAINMEDLLQAIDDGKKYTRSNARTDLCGLGIWKWIERELHEDKEILRPTMKGYKECAVARISRKLQTSSVVQIKQHYKGVVVEINPSIDFRALLHALVQPAPLHCEFFVFEEIPQEDQSLIKLGAVFDFIIGNIKEDESDVYGIVFRREEDIWTKEEAKWEMEKAKAILERHKLSTST